MIYHLCNINTPKYKDWETITSEAGIPRTIEDGSIWLICVHLGWNDNALHTNYGFDISTLLRLNYESRNPIILYSPLPKSYFETLSETTKKYKILFGRGIIFLETPFSIEDLVKEIETIEGLNAASLYDVSVTLCNLKGIVVEKLKHDLKFEHGVEGITKTFEEVSNYLSYDLKNSIRFSEYLIKLKDCVVNSNRRLFLIERELFIRLCNTYLNEGLYNTHDLDDGLRHCIIVVDDDPDFLQSVKENLIDRFNVYAFNKSIEAWEFLQKDDGLAVRAIICDWRLYQGKYWQPIQGYELLEKSGKTAFRALFALTMQDETLVHHIRNRMSVGFTLYKKDNLEEPGQWKAFKDLIEQQCSELNEVISAIPRKDSWIKPQRKGRPSYYEDYLNNRNSPNWRNFETGISESSNMIWKEYYWKYLLNDLDEVLQDFGKRFGLPLNSIEAILIARRICLALYFRNNYFSGQNILGEHYPRVDVYCIFRNKFFNDLVEENRSEKGDEIEEKGKMLSVEEFTRSKLIASATTLLNTDLGLDMEQVASLNGIFPEERNWLIRNEIKFSLEYLTDTDEKYFSEQRISEFKPAHSKDEESTDDKMQYLDDDIYRIQSDEIT